MQVQVEQALFEAIEAYKNGNGEKATFIYDATKKYAYSIIYQQASRFKSQGVLTGDANAFAEDIMQELYLNFFSNIEKFKNENEKSIYKWISVVSYRMILDFVDKNKMEVLQFAKDKDYREESDIWDSSEVNDGDLEGDHEMLPEAALENKEFRQLILDFINELPETQAQTILLHFRGGMKYQEIADELGVSLITVKTRMKKAKDSLEEIITKYEEKTGTKLHSVSILPLLWLLYRMSAEETVVPAAVDTAVAGSLAGASGTAAGSVATAGVTKAIGTRMLIGIVSATVAIGGAVVGSQFIEQEQDVVTEQEQENKEDKEEVNQDDLQENTDKEDIQESKQEVGENKVEDEPIPEENKEQPVRENVITIPQEQIEARKIINQAYREFLVQGGCEGLYVGPIYQFGIVDVNGDGIEELLFYSYNPATGNDTGPDYMMTYDGEVCGAGKGFGSMHNTEYCTQTKRFIQKYYYEDGSYDFRLYNFDGKYFGEESVNIGERQDMFIFYVDSNGQYYWGSKDYAETLSDDQQVYVKQKLQEYLPDSQLITANYQINETNLNVELPVDEEGIKQQLINEQSK